jgi:hypothetical protein
MWGCENSFAHSRPAVVNLAVPIGSYRAVLIYHGWSINDKRENNGAATSLGRNLANAKTLAIAVDVVAGKNLVWRRCSRWCYHVA